MKRRFLFWLALAALALRIVAPLAAYGSAMAGPGFNDVCSAYGQAPSTGGAPLGEPGSAPARHLLSCCADCRFGGGAAMLPAAFVLPLFAASAAVAAPIAPRVVAAAAPSLFPPPRGPPASLAAID